MAGQRRTSIDRPRFFAAESQMTELAKPPGRQASGSLPGPRGPASPSQPQVEFQRRDGKSGTRAVGRPAFGRVFGRVFGRIFSQRNTRVVASVVALCRCGIVADRFLVCWLVRFAIGLPAWIAAWIAACFALVRFALVCFALGERSAEGTAEPAEEAFATRFGRFDALNALGTFGTFGAFGTLGGFRRFLR
jgi:hypothetical protein